MVLTIIKYFLVRLLLLVFLCLGSIFFYMDYEEFFLAYAFSILTGLFFWSGFLLIESYFFHQKKLLLKRNLNLIVAIPVFILVLCFGIFVVSI